MRLPLKTFQLTEYFLGLFLRAMEIRLFNILMYLVIPTGSKSHTGQWFEMTTMTV